MSFMGKKAFELAEGICGVVKKYDPEGKQEMSHAVDRYIEHWASKVVQELEEKIEGSR